MSEKQKTDAFFTEHAAICAREDQTPAAMFEKYGVKHGLRDKDGTGIVAGLTNISRIDAFEKKNGEKVPCAGKLWYRGYNINDLVGGFIGQRFGFEEIAYLVLFGELPTPQQLEEFCLVLSRQCTLPRNFTRDVIMKAPMRDIMNSLTKSTLTLAYYDHAVNDLSVETVLRQSLRLIALFPMLSVYAYRAYYYTANHSLYIHRPRPELSTAENILRMLRPDKKYTPIEAQVLDMALVLHMEHGGGNNSTFTTRVVTSAGSDTYAAITAALSSLKGPKHGGANIKVVEMMHDICSHVKGKRSEDKLRDYLVRILDRKAFDGKGLIYGMGHAVYSLSDPRAEILKKSAYKLAVEKGKEEELELYETVARLASELISEKRRIYKGVSTNIDFYSGFVYNMLGIPLELYTPMFAVARIVGWCAHRLEELVNSDKIIRPAYESISGERNYTDLEDR